MSESVQRPRLPELSNGHQLATTQQPDGKEVCMGNKKNGERCVDNHSHCVRVAGVQYTVAVDDNMDAAADHGYCH